MHSAVAAVVMIGSLAAAAWCLRRAASDEWLGTGQLVALGLVALAVTLQGFLAVLALAAGHRPVELVTFAGYLATSLLLIPAGLGLAAMERTRWGSVIAAAAALVSAVVVLRLLQVWTPLR